MKILIFLLVLIHSIIASPYLVKDHHSIVLEKGKHVIEISIPGHEKLPPLDLNIKDSKLYPLTLPRLVPKTTAKAFMRSALIPGWGQHYHEKPMKTIGFGTAALLSGLFCLHNQLQYDKISNDYEDAMDAYQNSGTDLDMHANHMLSMHGQLEVNEKNTNLGLSIFGAMYALNLLDILLDKPFENSTGFSKNGLEHDVKVGMLPNGDPSLKIGIRF